MLALDSLLTNSSRKALIALPGNETVPHILINRASEALTLRITSTVLKTVVIRIPQVVLKKTIE